MTATLSLSLTHQSFTIQVLGHGASGEVLLAIHKVTQQQFACKVVRKDTKMNDAQVIDGETSIFSFMREGCRSEKCHASSIPSAILSS